MLLLAFVYLFYPFDVLFIRSLCNLTKRRRPNLKNVIQEHEVWKVDRQRKQERAWSVNSQLRLLDTRSFLLFL